MGDSTLRHRPIYGGVFGMGRYALATMPCVMRGLHAVRFMVIDPKSGAVLSLADDKTDALDAARKMIVASELHASGVNDDDALEPYQGELWPRPPPVERPVVDRGRPISRRRRDIFSKCSGCCHYCATPLQLDGHWHVEHMQPRALGGSNDPGNLVAACVPCNLEKRDRTAVEFLIGRSEV